ncbi:MAG: DUF3575 domain-containing protein, partial [Paramuribaculum sp.]|nr:DUF3575 domain-containing protein [Paramuribaculum sp.]
MLTKSLQRLFAVAAICLAAIIATPEICAQHDVALKTNLFYDATATINAGAEMQVA